MTRPPTGPAQPSQTPETKPPGKGLAVASLVLGVLGPCTVGLGSLIGVILGAVALAKLSKARAASGKGLAVAGVVVSGLGFLLIPVLAILIAILLPAISSAQAWANQAAFMRNLKQLSTAAQVYATERDGRLPPPPSWVEELEQQGVLADLDKTTCAPGDEEAVRAVAMNAALKGTSLHGIPAASRTVLFFECRPGAPPAGGPEILPPEPRYRDGYVIAFCDGHVESVPPEEVGDLVWAPGGRRCRRLGFPIHKPQRMGVGKRLSPVGFCLTPAGGGAE